MTRGQTVLIMKDPEKDTSPGNYRPIKCLPVIWKMLTGIISEEVYQYLDREDLFPEEQKGSEKVHGELMTSYLLTSVYLEKEKPGIRT